MSKFNHFLKMADVSLKKMIIFRYLYNCTTKQLRKKDVSICVSREVTPQP